VKITEAGKALWVMIIRKACLIWSAKPSMLINGDLIEDRRWLAQLIIITYENLPAMKVKK
jgi:hypothetical protein